MTPPVARKATAGGPARRARQSNWFRTEILFLFFLISSVSKSNNTNVDPLEYGAVHNAVNTVNIAHIDISKCT